MKTHLLTVLLASTLFAGQTMAGHAATANSTTPNIFSDETVFANSIYDSDFKYSGAVDGIATAFNGTNPQVYKSEFVFADGATPPDLLSISGFDASAGIGSITFFGTGEYGGDRAANSVVIYTSTTDYTDSADALNTANYTALDNGEVFTLPTNSNASDFSEGVDSAGTQGFDTLTGLDIPVGTESILFSFTRPGTAGTGFSEIQGFAVPEPSTYAMMLGGLALLGFCVRRKGMLTS